MKNDTWTAEQRQRAEAAAKAGNMTEANDILGLCGVEFVGIADRELEYCNTGETYNETLCRDDSGNVFWSSWGDWVEQTEAEYAEETDSIQCGYCGEFTPLCEAALAQPAGNRPAWRDTVCEHCGHNVANP